MCSLLCPYIHGTSLLGTMDLGFLFFIYSFSWSLRPLTPKGVTSCNAVEICNLYCLFSTFPAHFISLAPTPWSFR